MLTWRRKPDGRPYLDLTLQGRRRRISLLLDSDPPGAWIDDLECARRAADFELRVLPGLRRGAHRRPAPAASASPGNPTLRELAEYYTDTYLAARAAAPKSVHKARQVLADFDAWARAGHVGRAQQLNRAVTDRWAAHLLETGRAPKTAHNYLGTLRAALRAALDAGLIDHLPITKWLMPKVPETARDTLTAQQVAQILSILRRDDPQYYPPIAWIALTGQRPSDTVALQWRQVDLAHGYVERPQVKVKRLARFPLSPQAVQLLQSIRPPNAAPNDPVFVRDCPKREARVDCPAPQSPTPIADRTLLRRLQAALTRANFPIPHVTLYTLRHTFGTLLANDPDHPCPLTTLAILMGHSRIETTLRYIRPTDGAPHVAALAKKICLDTPNNICNDEY